ncbi:hypothetical protein PVAP13_3NG249763 [Panicum virgatum]|uniref:Uncharacterized protein n=1 Tax=Panicum virgatum TaxID=38727 RepID=A0A8T0U9C1_PANVG|nr:hypothetical protein PVAP13_3NG249763 [Panicum virgatum]
MAGRQNNTGASASAMAAALLLLLLLPVGLPAAAAAAAAGQPVRGGDDVQDPRPQLLGVYPPLKGHLPPARRAYAASYSPGE